MSWESLPTSGPGTPPGLGLRELVLGALAGTAIGLRAATGFCADCRDHGTCDDHLADLALAAQYEAAYMRAAGIGSDGAMLELTGGLR